MAKREYVSANSHLMSEWNWEKNNELGFDPHHITCGSAQKVWWKCEKGHEWLARIANRACGCNCPICSGKQVEVGWNDFESLYPSLAAEWHPIKNGALTPKDVTAGSNKSVWWRCEKGHEWEDTVTHRVSGRNCPICTGEAKTSFPEQAIFFYCSQAFEAVNRYRVTARTEIDVYLPKYRIGIEYDGAAFHQGAKALAREIRKNQVLEKMGIILIRVKEMLDLSEPKERTVFCRPGATDLELNVMLSRLVEEINAIAGLSIELDIDITRDRAKIYEQYIQLEKENSLALRNSKLAAEWHPVKNGLLLPSHVSTGSNKKVWWLCENGHEWEAIINSRNKGHGCPYCAGQRVLPGINDLATLNPSVAAQWHPTKNGSVKPSDVAAQSNQSFWWQCEKGHAWQVSVSHRIRGNGCPICSGHQVLPGYNDLETVLPLLALQWHPTKNGDLKPSDVTRGSKKKVWWLCKNGHEWQAVVSSRSAGRGCPRCAREQRSHKREKK